MVDQQANLDAASCGGQQLHENPAAYRVIDPDEDLYLFL
jgi:hypothetical protein